MPSEVSGEEAEERRKVKEKGGAGGQSYSFHTDGAETDKKQTPAAPQTLESEKLLLNSPRPPSLPRSGPNSRI